ncbi:DUF4238 domain-containing protein [Paraburkholderia sp. SG-MS1]|uniref:DUF4238 domain-containing protein n=1 Tax=Paraburkholderia sp. SG-MS1 TaxID=2023741 RepID=UPI001444A332|nr:DUF4238 domain-containing protein [Paraburkholderia sp. SG-MS1]
MSKRKNHHFVPQFYFRRFSLNERSICALPRTSGKAIRTASIKAQASKDWFYGSDDIEALLGRIEAESSLALRALAEQHNPMDIPPEHVDNLFVWLTLQRSRTDAARQGSKPMHDKMLQLFLSVEIANDESLTEDQRTERLKEAESMSANPAHAQAVEMEMSIAASKALMDLHPLLLENRTNRPFIFGDSPVVLHNAFFGRVKSRGVLGYDTPGLMLSYPLGPDLSLLLVDDACYRVKRAREGRVLVRDLNDVMALNKLQLHAASSCVYFHDFKYEPYVEGLWNEERAALAPHAGSVHEAPGFDADTADSLGDIVHFFQPLLPYELRLSFLEHDVLSDVEYRFSRRSQR